ncbi:MAG: threonine-phosphate decarboxylase CobD [Shinella sp.]|nr:threonine-phosphate decarboxylase CobD [Shinella sp.]
MSEPAILHGGGITAAAERFGGRAEDWLDLSTGINPCPVALPAIDASAWHRLPDRHRFDAARRAAAQFYGAHACLPLPVPGTQSVIQLLPRLVGAGRRAAILSPTYGEYGRVLRNAGVSVDAVSSLEEIGETHGLAVVVNPNNPDGRLLGKDDLLALCGRLHASGGMLLVDEAFGDMEPQSTLAPVAGGVPGLVVFRSFGKFFGLAGLRLGFVLAGERVAADFSDALGPWAVSGPALELARKLMEQDAGPIREAIRIRKLALDAVLAGAGLRVCGGTALFSLVEHPQAVAIHEALCRRHILVRAFDYQPRWLRFGLAPDGQADMRLAEALRSSGLRR